MGQVFKVLIVDDDPFMGEVYESLLSQLAMTEVEYLSSGYEALEYLKRERVDLVIADYYMPKGDGGTLCHYCADHDISCVVMSSHGPQDIIPYVPKNIEVLHKPDLACGRILEDLVLERRKAARN